VSDAAWGAVWFALIFIVVPLASWAYRRIRYPKSWCSCDGGKKWAPGGGRWRDHSQCGGTGVRDRRR
jgi:hypothetical protein